MNWSDIPSLAALRAFDALARHGTMTAAAQSLNVTHAAIAQHVRALESHFDTPLTKRVGRHVEMTPDGEELAGTLSKGFEFIHAGIRKLSEDKEGRPISVTATPSFTEHWLMPRLGQFWRKHPEIEVSISPSSNVVDLHREPFDLAIRYGGGVWPGLRSTFLVPADYILVAAPELVAERSPKGIEDLQDQLWLFNSFYREPRRWAEENGLDMRCCQVKEFENISMIISALCAGVGVSVVSKALISRELESGQLCKIVDVPPDGMGYHIVTRNAPLSQKARIFKTWLTSAV